MSQDATPSPSDVPRPWWDGAEVLILIALVIAAYFFRAGDLPLRGEEPTRAQVAYEMAASGDYLVPRFQGESFRIRPPAQMWAIAACCLALDDWGETAVRFHSILATLFTAVLVHVYARQFLSRWGALAAGLAFATFGDWFYMGLQAETEALFTLFVAASLLVWHLGVMRKWPDALSFSLGYALMVLGMLTKGMQAPAYFVGAIGVYLVLTRQWRRLFGVGHLVGIGVGVAVLAAWVVPYALRQGWGEALEIWMGDPAYRQNGQISAWKVKEFAVHLVNYPAEVGAGLLPWSPLLLFYLWPSFRRALGPARPAVAFVVTAIAVAFPTCWLPPAGQPRYAAPLFPLAAVLIGVVVQRAVEAEVGSLVRNNWRRYLAFVAGLTVLVGLGLGVAPLLAGATAPAEPLPLAAGFGAHGLASLVTAWTALGQVAEPLPIAVGYVLASLTAAWLLWRAREPGLGRGLVAVGALACFMGLTFAVVENDRRVRKSEQPAESMRQLKQGPLADHPLVSLGYTHPLFLYYYGREGIDYRPWEQAGEPLPEGAYFCFEMRDNVPPPLPFAWEEVAQFKIERYKREKPRHVVVVARRVAAAKAEKSVGSE